MEIAQEYVHIVLPFPSSKSIGEVVGIIKSKNARGLFCEFPFLKKKLYSGELRSYLLPFFFDPARASLSLRISPRVPMETGSFCRYV